MANLELVYSKNIYSFRTRQTENSFSRCPSYSSTRFHLEFGYFSKLISIELSYSFFDKSIQLQLGHDGNCSDHDPRILGIIRRCTSGQEESRARARFTQTILQAEVSASRRMRRSTDGNASIRLWNFISYRRDSTLGH